MSDGEYAAIGKCVDCGCPLLDPSQWSEGWLDDHSVDGPTRTLYVAKCPVCGQKLYSTPELNQPPDTIEWQKPLNS
jgi:hypothetical protein